MNEFEDCATQFKKDVIVNKDDTEEAIWNMACQTNLNIENGKGIKEALEDARKNIIDGMDKTFNTWTPRPVFDLIKIEDYKPNYLKYPVSEHE